MIHFLPFRAEHMTEIGDLRAACGLGNPAQLAEVAVAIEQHGRAWTGRIGERTMGCAGVLPLGHGRGNAWAMFSLEMPRRAFPAITAYALRVLDEAQGEGFQRIETYVRLEFTAGVRWALRLGFENPFPMRKFNAGDDYWMMERVR